MPSRPEGVTLMQREPRTRISSTLTLPLQALTLVFAAMPLALFSALPRHLLFVPPLTAALLIMVWSLSFRTLKRVDEAPGGFYFGRSHFIPLDEVEYVFDGFFPTRSLAIHLRPGSGHSGDVIRFLPTWRLLPIGDHPILHRLQRKLSTASPPKD